MRVWLRHGLINFDHHDLACRSCTHTKNNIKNKNLFFPNNYDVILNIVPHTLITYESCWGVRKWNFPRRKIIRVIILEYFHLKMSRFKK